MVGIKRLIQEAEGPFSPVGSPTKPITLLDAMTLQDTNCDNSIQDSCQDTKEDYISAPQLNDKSSHSTQ